MSDPNDRYYLARVDPQPLATPSPQSLETTTTQDITHPQQPQRIVVHIVQHPAEQTTAPPPSHYTTVKARGTPPPPLPQLQLPNLLTLTLSVVVALLLLVSASMFSIALTAYSNSVDRVDNNRSFIHVE